MPEIGECYTIARLLDKEKEKIKEVKTSDRFSTHILKSPLFKLKTLQGMKIDRVFAYGKSVWFELTNDTERVIIVSQLGMSGSWFIDKNGRPPKNDHFTLVGEKKTLRYSDPRMFGKMRFFGFKKEDLDWKEKVLENFSFGADPLEMSAAALQKTIEKAWNKDKEIKILMMEQNVLFGIGNYLCSEILYKSKIHPQTKGNKLSSEDFKALSASILSVCKLAVKTGGHSFAEGFFHPDGSVGHMSKYIVVYGKEGDNCEFGHSIKRIEQADRGTFFCPRCQPKK